MGRGQAAVATGTSQLRELSSQCAHVWPVSTCILLHEVQCRCYSYTKYCITAVAMVQRVGSCRLQHLGQHSIKVATALIKVATALIKVATALINRACCFCHAHAPTGLRSRHHQQHTDDACMPSCAALCCAAVLCSCAVQLCCAAVLCSCAALCCLCHVNNLLLAADCILCQAQSWTCRQHDRSQQPSLPLRHHRQRPSQAPLPPCAPPALVSQALAGAGRQLLQHVQPPPAPPCSCRRQQPSLRGIRDKKVCIACVHHLYALARARELLTRAIHRNDTRLLHTQPVGTSRRCSKAPIQQWMLHMRKMGTAEHIAKGAKTQQPTGT
jgi:hypothetical protein